MPKYVNWDAQNDMKLFYAILAVHNLKIDFVAVAKIFGEPAATFCPFVNLVRKFCIIYKILVNETLHDLEIFKLR